MADSTGLGVGVIAKTPGSKETHSGHIAVPMILNVLLQYHDEIHVFTRSTAVMSFNHDDIYLHKISKPFADSRWYLRLPGQFIYQCRYAFHLAKYRSELDLIFLRGSSFIIPLLTAKILGMCVLSRLGGVVYEQSIGTSNSVINWFSSTMLWGMEMTLHRISDVLILTNPSVAEFAGIDKFESLSSKAHVWCHYYLDFDQFSVTAPYSDRDQIVGQVGVISETKGTIAFLKSMANVHRQFGAKSLIVGDGPVISEAREICSIHDMGCEFTGVVDRDEVPNQMNRMKLLVHCSISEGLPKVVIEAMACGTPVLATPVGGIPDVIEGGKNGLLVESNEPATLSNAIREALTNSELDKISKSAREYAKSTYSFENSVYSYREMINAATKYELPHPSGGLEEPIPVP